jgi:hypothetical protein
MQSIRTESGTRRHTRPPGALEGVQPGTPATDPDPETAMNFDFKAMGEKAKAILKTAGAKTVKAATEVRERTDRAAEAVAAKVTAVTGRETTAAEVKKAAAVVAGAVVLGTGALAAVSAHRGAVGAVGAVLGGAPAAGGSDGDWGGDFESRMARGVAKLGGSINYYTPRTDPTGTVYYEPHG